MSRFVTDVEGRHFAGNAMDSDIRLFESSAEAGFSVGTPMPCRRVMRAATLIAWTPAAVVGALFSAVLAVPRALVLAPAVIRRRA
jgi:hypothetical protein